MQLDLASIAVLPRDHPLPIQVSPHHEKDAEKTLVKITTIPSTVEDGL